MSAKYFLDTNIFIYSFDRSQPMKRTRARKLIAEALQTRDGLISTQVINEFLNVATRKFNVPLGLDDCKDYLVKILFPLCQVFPDLDLYRSCLEIQHKKGYSFYDSLILAGALSAGCNILYSEDLQAGQHVDGLQIANPFLAA
jgi:predicted nucleic acid-binding protein